jgi:hypothetical protein
MCVRQPLVAPTMFYGVDIMGILIMMAMAVAKKRVGSHTSWLPQSALKFLHFH